MTLLLFAVLLVVLVVGMAATFARFLTVTAHLNQSDLLSQSTPENE
jgi:hypothetical protein